MRKTHKRTKTKNKNKAFWCFVKYANYMDLWCMLAVCGIWFFQNKKTELLPNEILNYRQWIRFVFHSLLCVCVCVWVFELYKMWTSKESKKSDEITFFCYSIFGASHQLHVIMKESISYGYTSMFQAPQQTTNNKRTKN